MFKECNNIGIICVECKSSLHKDHKQYIIPAKDFETKINKLNEEELN